MALDSLTDRLLTPGEVAALFRVDPKTVGRWARAGRFPDTAYGTPGAVLTLGGHVRLRESVVRGLLAGSIAMGDDDGDES